jgi:Putative MetA-pathway of phenol degradation
MVAIAAIGLAAPAAAQDMEPRAYSSSPIGLNFIATGIGNTQGALLFDPTVPIEDAHANLNLGTLGYARTFDVAGRQALMGGGMVYARGVLDGLVAGNERHTGRSGLADLRFKVAVNLVGPPAMTREQFAKAPHRTVFGASLTIQAPTGQYDSSRLVNLGQHRWAFKPEVGVSVPVGRWFLDAYFGAWFYTPTDHFYPGDSTRRQDPLTAIQGHASYTFKSRAWVAIDTTWYGGGEATVDDGEPSSRQSSTRVGGTGSIPVTRRQSIKIAASTGAWVRTGTNFDTYTVGWQFAWFDPRVPVRP